MDTVTPAFPVPLLAALLQRTQGADPAFVHLSEAETADSLNLQRKTLEDWRREGLELPFLKIGRSVRYRLSDVLAFLERNTFASTQEAKTRDRRIPTQRRSRRAA